MRLIDADELLEHVGRDRLDSRERIAQMIKNAPTVCDIEQIREEIRKIVDFVVVNSGIYVREYDVIQIIDKYTKWETK